MKRIVLILFLLMSNCFLYASSKVSIAILPFSGTTIGDFKENLDLSHELTKALLKSDKLIIVERQQIDKILDEISLSLSGLVDDISVIKSGKFSSYDYLINGKFLSTQNNITLTIKIIDVETSKEIKSDYFKINKGNELESIWNIADSISYLLVGEYLPRVIKKMERGVFTDVKRKEKKEEHSNNMMYTWLILIAMALYALVK